MLNTMPLSIFARHVMVTRYPKAASTIKRKAQGVRARPLYLYGTFYNDAIGAYTIVKVLLTIVKFKALAKF